MIEDGQYFYGGLSGAILREETFELGENVILRQTYAHLMSPSLVAFSRPGIKGYHPGPWKTTKGGFGFDIEIELMVPNTNLLGGNMEPREIIWWIAALLRMARAPYLSVPVISNQSFESIKDTDIEPTIEPFETEPRIMKAPEEQSEIPSDTLEWVKEKWIIAGKMLNSNPKFYSAVKAFDFATIKGKTSSSLLALWGGLELLFSPSAGELRFRVASLLASFLESPGEQRFNLYKKILKLYDERSLAAHTAKEVEIAPLVDSYVLMRNALVKIIDETVIPTQQELEKRLFGC